MTPGHLITGVHPNDGGHSIRPSDGGRIYLRQFPNDGADHEVLYGGQGRPELSLGAKLITGP